MELKVQAPRDLGDNGLCSKHACGSWFFKEMSSLLWWVPSEILRLFMLWWVTN